MLQGTNYSSSEILAKSTPRWRAYQGPAHIAPSSSHVCKIPTLVRSSALSFSCRHGALFDVSAVSQRRSSKSWQWVLSSWVKCMMKSTSRRRLRSAILPELPISSTTVKLEYAAPAAIRHSDRPSRSVLFRDTKTMQIPRHTSGACQETAAADAEVQERSSTISPGGGRGTSRSPSLFG